MLTKSPTSTPRAKMPTWYKPKIVDTEVVVSAIRHYITLMVLLKFIATTVTFSIP